MLEEPAWSAEARQSLLEGRFTRRPFRCDDRIHGGIAQPALFAGSPRLRPTPEHALEVCAEALDGATGPLIARIGLDVDPGDSQLFERMREQQQLGFDVDPGALRRGA